jgi:carboxymethylenebutenolidase
MKKHIILLSFLLVFSVMVYLTPIDAISNDDEQSSKIMSDLVCEDKLCPEVDVSHMMHSSIAYFPSPLKQINNGQNPSNVTCTEGLSLVLKQSTGFPACVKPTSIEKLIQRGWAIHILPDSNSDNTNSDIFKIGEFETVSETVNYFGTTSGYLVRPIVDNNYPAIIMIHEWWGLNENIKEMAKKLASHGYVVLAVDLYDGQVATTSEEARILVTSFDKNIGIENMNSAVSYIDENYSPEKIGSLGWCFGGGQSLNLALNNTSIDATVIYYGSLVTDTKELSVITWPVLGIFGELDKGITVDTVNTFENSLNQLGIQNEIIIYPSADHAFANPSGDRYAPEASQDAWQKTLQFLQSNLK